MGPDSQGGSARKRLQLSLALVGVALLILWGYWWVSSIRLGKLRSGHRTWIPTLEALCLDFGFNYYAVQDWREGRDPYHPLGRPRYAYAPAVIWMFAWTRYLDFQSAGRVWIVALALIASIGAWLAWRARQALDISRLPMTWVLACLLCSTPVVFAMERGNCDLLVLLFVITALCFLAGKTVWQDILAGVCLALAFYVKAYAGLVVLGLLSARRLRVVSYLVFAAVLIAAADVNGTLAFVYNLSDDVHGYDINFHWSAHPFSTYWWHLWGDFNFVSLATIPGTLAALVTLLPLAFWVSLQVFRCRDREPLLYPYFCWLIALGTFVPRISNDYNLFFLPLAALAVWSRRDPPIVHMLMTPLLVWWQPLQFSISHKQVFFFKLSGLVAVAISLVVRARERRDQARTEQLTEPASVSLAVANAA